MQIMLRTQFDQSTHLPRRPFGTSTTLLYTMPHQLLPSEQWITLLLSLSDCLQRIYCCIDTLSFLIFVSNGGY
jgi:hypothetical protein